MPAMNARIFNPLLKEFGDQLQTNGKNKKQIIIAIMRKIIHQIYGILKSREPYNPEKKEASLIKLKLKNHQQKLLTFRLIFHLSILLAHLIWFVFIITVRVYVDGCSKLA